MQSVTAIRYIRFHAVLHDEIGVYDEDAQGWPITTGLMSIRYMTDCWRGAFDHSWN